MKIYKLLLLVGMLALVGACTPTAKENVSDQSSAFDQSAENAVDVENNNDSQEAEAMPLSISFLTYENRAVGYKINIPTTWYWQHFIKSQIANANPEVDNYLFISPTRPVTSIRTGLAAEITIEVSQKELAEFSDDSLSETNTTLAGQDAIRVEGVVNNETLENYKKIEYRFVKDDQTFRIIYLAPDGMTDNQRVFEEIVKSLSFVR